MPRSRSSYSGIPSRCTFRDGVSGLSSDEAVQKFLKAVPLVEKAIVGSGILLIKYWLEVERGRADRAARLAHRRRGGYREPNHPFKFIQERY